MSRKRYLAIAQSYKRGRITDVEKKLCGTYDAAWNYVNKRGEKGLGNVIVLTPAGAKREAEKAGRRG